ncbi:MAG TPA: DinB family protein [Planctomycetota bacterium]|nr:DinB family protein [Planctomycetota bacterium]
MAAPEPSADATALARGVATEFRRRLLGEQLPRLRRCVELLGEAGVWRRPGPTCNSVGNLLLHLAGNTTQWILATFGDVPDRRDRPAEFAADGSVAARELVDRLAAVFERACDLVDRVSVDDLLRARRVQGRFEETGLSAILHVLEHCSGHAAQVYAWTKQVTGQDLRFYDL